MNRQIAYPFFLLLAAPCCGGEEVMLGTQPPDATPPPPDSTPPGPDAAPLMLGDTWSQAPGPNGGSVESFASGATRLYAGTYQTLYGSDDDGISWQPLAPIVEDLPYWYIGRVAAQGDDVAVLTNGPTSHLLISHDRGATFETDLDAGSLFSALMYFAGDRLLISNGSNLLALDRTSTVLQPLEMPPDAFPIPDPYPFATVGDTVVLLTMSVGAQTAVWVSTDRGDTFNPATGTPSNPAPFDPPFFTGVTSFDGTFYLSANNLSGDQGWRSTDGDAWEGLGADFPGGIGSNEAAMADGSLYTFDQYHIWRSPFTPVSWTLDSTSFGTVQETPVFNRIISHDGQVLIASMDQQVYRRQASGEWTLSNDGMRAPQIAALGATDDAIVASIGFGKVMSSLDGGDTWLAGRGLPHGFGANAFLGEPGLFLTGDSRNGIYRSHDGGATWTDSSSGYGEYNGMAGWQRREVAGFARSNDAIYVATGSGMEGAFEGETYITGGGVYRSVDEGLHWSAYNQDFPILGAGLEGPRYDPCLAVHAIGDTVLVAASTAGMLRNDGAGWEHSSTGLGGFPAVVGFADDGTTVWTALGGYGASGGGRGVYRSDDDGHTWTRTDGAFFSAKMITGMTRRQGTLLVSAADPDAGMGGIYASTDDGATWSLVGDWDSSVGGDVRSLLVTDRTLFAGTATQGLWRLMINSIE